MNDSWDHWGWFRHKHWRIQDSFALRINQGLGSGNAKAIIAFWGPGRELRADWQESTALCFITHTSHFPLPPNLGHSCPTSSDISQWTLWPLLTDWQPHAPSRGVGVSDTPEWHLPSWTSTRWCFFVPSLPRLDEFTFPVLGH